MPEPRIQLQIDEIVIDALPFDGRHRVLATVEQKLTRLLTDAAATARFNNQVINVPNHEIEVSPNWSAEAIGHHVAQSTFDQMVQTSAQNL